MQCFSYKLPATEPGSVEYKKVFAQLKGRPDQGGAGGLDGKTGHFAPGHSTGRAKSGHFGTQPRTLWYQAQDTTAPDTLRECLAPPTEALRLLAPCLEPSRAVYTRTREVPRLDNVRASSLVCLLIRRTRHWL